MEAGLPTAEAALDPAPSKATGKGQKYHAIRKQLLQQIKAFTGHATPISLFYLILYFLGIDHPPDGPWFALTALWLSSIVGGYAAKAIGLPPLVGQLVAGIILANTSAPIVPEKWGERLRSSGLVVILLRSGLDMNVDKIRKAGKVALSLTFLPAIMEAVVTALASVVILDMIPSLALAQGFILAAVSPAVVVGGMLDLRRRGYGVGKGIPSLVIASASLDDIVAISAFSMCIGLAIRDSERSLLWLILNMPLTVCFGVGIGVAGGLLLSQTQLWDKRWKRTTLLLLLGLVSMVGTKKLDFAGAGALASVTIATIVSYFWEGSHRRGKDKDAHANNNTVSQTSKDLAFLWHIMSEPLLFGYVGTALNFQEIPARTIPYSLSVVIIGLAARIPAAYLATHKSNMTRKERSFIALSWCPKATVQAALSPLPLAMANELMAGKDNYEQYAEWSRQIIGVAIVSILVTAPIGSIFIERYGPRWLSCDAHPSSSVEKQGVSTKDCSDAIDNLKKAKEYISEVDALMSSLVIQNDSVTISCTIAEVRQLLWHCKKVGGTNTSSDNDNIGSP